MTGPAPAVPPPGWRPYDPTDCVGERVVQHILDVLLGLVIELVVIMAGYGVGLVLIVGLRNAVGVVLGGLFIGLGFLGALAAQFWWFAWWPSRHGDQSWAMAQRGLRVVKTDGSPVTLTEHTLRWLLLIADGAFYGIVGLIVMSQSVTHQRLGDMVTKTVVIRVPR